MEELLQRVGLLCRKFRKEVGSQIEKERVGQSLSKVALLVPYSLSANHGNAVRVKNMIKLVNAYYNVVSFDLPWIRQKSVSIPFTIVLKAAFERLVRKRSILDLLLCEDSWKIKQFSSVSKVCDITQAENLWAIKPALESKHKEKPLIATLHDVYSDRMFELLTHFGVKENLKRDAVSRTLKLEMELISKVDTCVFVCREDLERYRELGVDPSKKFVIPNGVDTKKFRPLPKKQEYYKKYSLPKHKFLVLFSGSDMYQNREAVLNVLDVLSVPSLERCTPVFAGSISRFAQKMASAKRVNAINLGYVENLEEVYALCDVVFLPLNSGTGTKLKVLEALACGKTVIATKKAIRGFDVSHVCVVADTKEEQLKKIKELLTSDCFIPQENAREAALRYDWSVVMKEYEKVYLKSG